MDPATAPSNPTSSLTPPPPPPASAVPPVGLPSIAPEVATTSVSKRTKSPTPILIGILLLVLIAGGSYFGYKFYKQSSIPTPQAAIYTPVEKASSSPTPNVNDNSDTALSQDAQSIDTSLNSVDTEMTAVDQGMNDQEGNLSGN